MKQLCLFLSFAFLMLACGDGPKEVAIEAEPQEEKVQKHSIDLSAHDVPLMVEVDSNMLVNDTVAVEWNEEFGRLEVTIGPKFSITVMEGEPEMDRLKSSLQNDPLRTSTILEETPELIIYRSQFPDDALTFVHFYKTMRVGDRAFIIESNDQGRFNEQDVRTMIEAVVPRQQI
jgi:hypothetical protein